MEEIIQNFSETTKEIPENCGVEHVTASATISLPSENGDFDEQDSILLIEKRSFRPFKSSEDYLYAMREDLAEWLNGLYDLNIDVDNFFEMLENGVILCEHAINVKSAAEDFLQKNFTAGKKFSSRYDIPSYEVHFKRDSAPGSFFARDNVHNFIRWCRDLGVHDVLMFETDDLVLRKNEKHVILALLEIARRGARFGMAAPLLVQMEDDIDREIEKDRLAFEENERRVMIGQEENEMLWDEQTQIDDTEPPNLIYGPQPQVITNDLLSLDEMVRDLVERCTCPSQFPMMKVSEGKYRIGDTKVLIFVRILRNHVMVRVGGGWDTLHHYLDKHDPCRCRSGHRSTISAKIGFKNQGDGDRHLSSVKYERCTEGYPVSPVPRRRLKVQRNSLDGVSSLRHRSHSPALRREQSPNFPSRSSSQNQSKEQSHNGTNDSSFESNGEQLSPRKLSYRNSLENRDLSNSHIQREDSYLSKKNVIPPNPSSLKNSSPSVRNGSCKNKSPSFENLTKKNRYKNSADYGRKAWNAGPGLRSDIMRKNGIADPFDGKISRSNSSVSDGGFEFMLQKETPIRQSAKLGNNRVHAPVKSSKTAWSGRNQQNYSTLGSETVRPPKSTTRSARSASASPATTRKSFTSSAPSTPGNRSPKRHNLNVNALASVLPTDILNELPNDNGDKDAEILAQLEGFVNNYRAYVLDKLASEGRSLPPDLAESEKENDDSSQKSEKYKSIKPTPRKAGVGSRIPAPVF